MGILNDLANAQKNTNTKGRTARGNASAEDRPKTNTWMNIGYHVETEAGTEFISLPLGLAIDTMEPAAVRGQDPRYVAIQTARNELLKEIQEAGDNLEPGATIELPLVIQIRRINNELVISSDENPFSLKNSGLKLVAAS